MILFLVINTSTMEYRFTIKLIYENLLLYVSCNNEYRVLYFYLFLIYYFRLKYFSFSFFFPIKNN